MYHGVLTGRTRDTLFGVSAIEGLITELSKKDYTLRRWFDGVLGCGSFVLIPPDDNYYAFIVEEVTTSEWSSAHYVNRRQMKSIPQVVWDMCEKYDKEDGE